MVMTTLATIRARAIATLIPPARMRLSEPNDALWSLRAARRFVGIFVGIGFCVHVAIPTRDGMETIMPLTDAAIRNKKSRRKPGLSFSDGGGLHLLIQPQSTGYRRPRARGAANAEHERVRDQQERHDRDGNVKGGAEFARKKSGSIGLVERVNQVGAAPDIEDPDQRNAQAGSKRRQRQQSENGGNDIAIGCRCREGGRQVARDHAGNQERQADKAESCAGEQRPQRVNVRAVAQFRPDKVAP